MTYFMSKLVELISVLEFCPSPAEMSHLFSHCFQDKWESYANTNESFELFKHVSLMTLDSILKCAFSDNSNCQTDRWVHTNLFPPFTNSGLLYVLSCFLIELLEIELYVFAYVLIAVEQMHTSKQCMSSVIWLTCGSGRFHTTMISFSTSAHMALDTEKHAKWLTVIQVRSSHIIRFCMLSRTLMLS